ncbi:polymer-forming cytoskeletal protein [Paenibacillus sp. KN14-4R]|uniref:polymer-forming cytoskeletal protein n=1 Tax=Paenibacillus sp. KN14-4R TaxID=3445773 RepID=UPI003F9F72CD
MRERSRDLVINGSGSSGGGVFQKVRISGSGKVTDDVQCQEFRCSGSGDVYGNVQAGNMKISGSANIDGNVTTDDLKISGSMRVDGDVSVKNIKISGHFKADGRLVAEDIELDGALELKEDCSAERFEVKGGFRIDGLLNVGKVNIQLHGDAHVREIGCDQIEVRRNLLGISVFKMIKTLFQSYHNELHVNTIEGDEIYLEYTKAKVVRGTNVTIGPGCEIDLVEYKGRYEQDKGADVGLSRIV